MNKNLLNVIIKLINWLATAYIIAKNLTRYKLEVALKKKVTRYI